MTSERGPFLAAAVLCERVLEEKDGVLSVIRVVDRVVHTLVVSAAPEQMPPVPISITALLSFKSGSALGRQTLVLRPEDPSGLRMPELVSFPVLFEGEDRGVTLVLNLNFQAIHEGLYWFDVFLDSVAVTRIPLRVVYQRISVGGQPTGGTPPTT